MRGLPPFFRARMQRRMFFAFGVSILLTILAASGVMTLFGNDGPTWKREVQRMQRFLGHRFERAWDDPQARAELLASTARDLDADVTLTDAHKKVLASVGQACRMPTFETDVLRGSELLGHVNLCMQRGHPFVSWRLGLGLFAAGTVLWAASGITARRLTRPIVELVRVAKDLGEGKLSSRVQLGRHARRHGEMSLLAETMNDMASRIEKQMADQRALLATVSHEIRTPLARMRILTEMLRDKLGDADELGSIDREVIEIDELVAELLASSRMDFSALTVTELSPTALASQALERANVDPSLLSAEGAPPKLRGDATLLVRAITNLLENAKKHGGGATSLAIVRDADLVRFTVDDEGPGLGDGEAARIFEPFYRGATQASGVGLGLALVKRIAEAHGGRAFATSREDKGASIGFEVRIAGPDDGATLPPITRC